ncbi:PPC domain-containing DNA-binding protein [Pelodictyon luteolum]|uniref:DNA-binding proteins with PD1-like DNA-binding motif protein n=1 Tax=Chlorobium luteolum (strain DSM 273 / BCRC 81028 / 2530) TaxID=319225 RepID=Q3B2B4_CHLL3|nr:PPC domain-containing DNA-binding protein [Pelodictyon luteolum]ABB24517.1 DNA-binding proteins with PD1-like DNA-binding motif protein [Pelodictyon luteolum DSM 273]
MAIRQAVEGQRRIMGRLEKGADILEGLSAVCREENVSMGRIEAIGAVTGARIGYYDQHAGTYRYSSIHGGREIVSLTGNISLSEGNPMIHAHIALADREGRMNGGHLAPGTTVFACEYLIEEFSSVGGTPLSRSPDRETGLLLWGGEER